MRNCTSKTGWISAPTQKKDFGALLKGTLIKGKSTTPNLKKSAAIHNRNLDAATTMPSCKGQ